MIASVCPGCAVDVSAIRPCAVCADGWSCCPCIDHADDVVDAAPAFGSSHVDRRQQSGVSLPREGGGGRAEPSPADDRRAAPSRSKRARS